MHRFRLMAIYVVLVVMALGCAIAGFAILGAAPATTPPRAASVVP